MTDAPAAHAKRINTVSKQLCGGVSESGWRSERKTQTRPLAATHECYKISVETLRGNSFTDTPTDTYTRDSSVDLGGILTFRVGILRGSHLQHTHPKGIDVYRFIVLHFIHLWSHKLWGTFKKQKKKKGEIADFHTSERQQNSQARNLQME